MSDEDLDKECPKCKAKFKSSGQSLHCWDIQYECGAQICGALDIWEFTRKCGSKDNTIDFKTMTISEERQKVLDDLNDSISLLTVKEITDLVKYLEDKLDLKND